MELSIYGLEIKITLDTLIASVAFFVSAVSLAASIRFWRKSFRPIVTATVKTHTAGNECIAYDLVFLNSGTIPAKNITVSADETSLSLAFGGDATHENKKKWLACFSGETKILILQNGDRISCSFGTTRSNNTGFWKNKATIPLVIKYEGWFGHHYTETQEVSVMDSDSFTGYMWARKDT